MVVILLGLKIDCQCTECNCLENFKIIEADDLLNLVQHGRLTSEQTEFFKTRIGSKVCKNCFIGKHYTL